MTSIASRISASLTGLPLIARTAESPRPMPHTVRFPYISFSVANSDAITVQSRVAGLVTIGPTMILWVCVEDAAVDHKRLFPQQVGVERPCVGEPVGLGLPGELDDPGCRRVGLEHDSEVHWESPPRSASGLLNAHATVRP